MRGDGFDEIVIDEDKMLGGVTLLAAFGSSKVKLVESDVDSTPKKIGGSVEEVQDWRDVRKAITEGKRKQVLGKQSSDLPQGIIVQGGHHTLLEKSIREKGGQTYSYTAETPKERDNLIKAGLNTIYEAEKSSSLTQKADEAGRDIVVKTDREELRVMERRSGTFCIFTSEFEKTFNQVEKQFDGVILTGLEPMQGNIEAKTSKAKNQLRELDLNTHLDFSHLNEKTSEMIAKHVLPVTDSIAIGPEELDFFSKKLEIESNNGKHEKTLRTISRLFQAFNPDRVIYFDEDVILVVDNEKKKLFPETILENLRDIREHSIRTLNDSFGKKDLNDTQPKEEGFKKLEGLSKEFSTEKLATDGFVESDDISVYGIPRLGNDSNSFYLEKMIVGSLVFGMMTNQTDQA